MARKRRHKKLREIHEKQAATASCYTIEAMYFFGGGAGNQNFVNAVQAYSVYIGIQHDDITRNLCFLSLFCDTFLQKRKMHLG